MDIYTIRTFADEIKRSTQFVRRAIELKKLEAEKIGHRWILSGSEARRFNKKPFQISRNEMVGR